MSDNSFAMDDLLFDRLIFEGTCDALFDKDYDLACADMALFFGKGNLTCDFSYMDKNLTLQEYQSEIQFFLQRHQLFCGLETYIDNIISSMKDIMIVFNDDNIGLFSEDILRKVLYESSGFLGDLQQGDFFASLHHFRALIELYASAFYCFSDEGKKRKMIEKYLYFPKAFFYQKLHVESSYLGLNQEKIDKLKKEYEKFEPVLSSLFNLKKRIRSWRGGLSIEDLLAKLPSIHSKNFEVACHCTHLSPLLAHSKRGLWGFPYYWDYILFDVITYVLDCSLLIVQQNCIDDEGQGIIIDNRRSLTDVLLSYAFEQNY